MFKCFECDGTVLPEIIDYPITLKKGFGPIVIEKLSVEKCNKCGELLFDLSACQRIETEITKKYPDYFFRK